ncbi:DUF7544 domain-containing protein [Halopiger goleimassiliensis]|uniref:DUF7544 domain-containing protein n=1 Tax=Halopiger goleimassiliensis TaxID=1293048 RepID=UPI0006781F4E|nr:hypothetical protein [Halopiger goleimassiliensis]
MDAVDDLGDAIDVTRELLLPFRLRRWLKLTVVVLFVGGFGFGGVAVSDPTIYAGPDEPVPAPTPEVEELIENVLPFLLVVAAIGIVLWLAFRLVAAIMEFVFVESLRSEEVRIRRYARENLGRGIRLFLFRLAGLLVVGSLVGIPMLYTIWTAPSLRAAAGTLLTIAAVGVPIALAFALLMRFTSEFVAPIMLLESRSVLGGWRRFWPTLRANWVEYAVYLVLVWILQLVINIGVAFLIAVGLIVLAIPFVILFLLLWPLGQLGLVLMLPLGMLAIVLALLVVALVQMPVRTYFQYYALLVLGDTNPDLDLVPDQRAAVRARNGRSASPRYEPRDGPNSGWEQRGSPGDESTEGRRDDDQSGAGWGSSNDWDDGRWEDDARNADREAGDSETDTEDDESDSGRGW